MDSVVYFVEAIGAGVVKIGTTKSINTRLATLRVSSPHHLKLIGTIPGGRALERRLHKRYSQDRKAGEWFNYTAILASDIRWMLLFKDDLPPVRRIPIWIHQDISMHQRARA
jgi:hypothetical protein